MSGDVGSLGKASLTLGAETVPFRKNIDEAKVTGRGMVDVLEAIAEAGKIADKELGNVSMGPGQAAESRATAREILEGVKGISDESRAAAEEIDRVKITETQATESEIAGDRIKENLHGIGDEADEAKRKVEEVGLANKTVGGTSIGLLGLGIGAGALLAPAAGPALLGLLGAIPALATMGVGALGTLMLAFHGVGAAIGGNEKAFKALQPAQQKFVLDIRSLDVAFEHLQQVAGHSMFPLLDQALHAALSTGTLHLLTMGVAAFGHAIGEAGLQWGRYFGSAQFQQTMGPLLQAGAHWFGQFSTVALHLVSALLTLAHAAIPFTSWLGDVSVKGAKWIDTLLRAKDATGQLSGAFHEARTSLALLGHLVEAAARLVYNLGAALYPVAKVAVHDLIQGLDWLAGVIHRNQDEIRAIVGGALAAFRATVAFLVPLIGRLVQGLDAVVTHMGGWKVAFALIISGFLAAKFIALSKTVWGFTTMVGRGAETAAAKLGLVTAAEAEVGPAALTAEGEAVGAFAGIRAAAAAALPEIFAVVAALAAAYGAYELLSHAGSGGPAKYNNRPGAPGDGQKVGANGATGYAGPPISDPEVKSLSGPTKPLTPAQLMQQQISQISAAEKKAQRQAKNLFRNPPPWTSGLGGGGGGGGGGGAGSSSGSSSVTNSLQNGIQHARDMAAQSQGATALKWLATEEDLLTLAKKRLQGELKGASASRAAAIEKQIRSLDGQITSVTVQIAADIRKAFAQPLSTAKTAIGQAMSQVQSALDAQFQANTQSYIDSVLGAQFFQGNDPTTGAQRLTPLEQQLQAMQQQDQLTSLQQAVATSTDPAAKAAAQRALDEYNLQIAAAKERAQADAGYAKAVQQYQADRAAAEKAMNSQLSQLSKAIQNGTGKLSSLNGIAGQFGVTLSGPGGVTGAMKTLGSAVHELARIMKQEAADIRKLSLTGGGTGGSHPHPKHPKHVIPMAAGGIGRVTMPTLFYSAGAEDFAFSGEGRSFGRLASADAHRGGDIVLVVDSRELARANAEGLSRDTHAVHITAKAVKPALGRVTSIGS